MASATLPLTVQPEARRRADARIDTPPSAARLAAFASMAVPLAGAGLPLGVYLPPFYAREFGLSLPLIGLIMLLGRLWDAVSDPLVGTLSDRTRTRFGRRRPWIAVGGVVFAFSTALLFFPGATITPLFLGVVLFFFYLGWTMIQVPLLAWSGELSSRYHERTRIVTYQQVAGAAALLLVLILPTVVDQLAPHEARLKIAVMGAFILVTLLPALLLTLNAFREPPLPARAVDSVDVASALKLVFRDRLLLRVLASDFAVTLGQSIRGALFVFFVTSYMGLAAWASGLFLFQFVFGIFAGPIWLRIGYRFGKHRTAVAGELLQMAINIGLLFVMPGGLSLLLGLTLAQGLAQGSGNLMLRSIVADVADRHRLETGTDRAGLFFSVFSLSGKAATAVAVGIALPLVAWLGFQASGSNNPAALDGLKLVFALGPALAHLLSASLIYGFPLDERRHFEIRAALDARDNTNV